MTLELVKEHNKLGEVSYYVAVDGSYQSGTVRHTIEDAMDAYFAFRDSYTKARTEVLMKEEI